MPLYEYSALKNNKSIVKGKIEADDSRQAREQILRMGLLPTKIENTQDMTASAKRAKKAPVVKLRSLGLGDKIEFTATLQVLSSTGIPIIETLAFIENNAESPGVRQAAFEIKRQVIAGATLAETLTKYREIFGRVFVGLVAAGEDSGELDKTLERMLLLLKKQDDIKSKVTGALVYPVFIVILAGLISIVMLGFVFPIFEDMFNGLGKELPLITKMCMAAGKFIQNSWYLLILGIAAIGFAIYKIFTIESSKKVVDNISLKIPIFGDIFKCANFSNFLSVMQVAYDAGIPIIDCLYLSNLTMENIVIRESILKATSKVQQGVHLSVALRSSGYVPTMVLFMMATGEQTGRLGDLLGHCIEFIDKKLDGIIDKFTKLIEPFMLIFVGGLVLVFALALYLPLFSAYAP